MNLINNTAEAVDMLKTIRKERGCSERIAITHLNSPTVFEAQNGQVGSVIKLQGIPCDTANDDELNNWRRIWHHALTTLDETFSVTVHIIRRKLNVNLEGNFNNNFCKQLDLQYHQRFNQRQLYTNTLYLTVNYHGLRSGKINKISALVQQLSRSAIATARDEWRLQAIEKLQKVTAQLLATLTHFQPVLVGSCDSEKGYSELLSFLGVLVNGGEYIPFKQAQSQPLLSRGLGEKMSGQQKYPYGHIGRYISAKRIFFGKYIELQDGHHQSRFGAILTIKKYPELTHCLMMDPLLHLDGEFIETHSFASEMQNTATKKIEFHYNKLVNSNDKAISQLGQLAQCKDDIASGRFRAGFHHHSLLLLADSISELENLINRAIKRYLDSGIVAFHDVLGQQALFWAQLPANQRFIVRAGFVTSQNFVDFVPFHNYRTGYRDRNHLGSAVTVIETPAKTPLFFNFHAKGSGQRNDLTPGHAAIIGGNGSGKTVLECFLDAQMTRYGGRSFFFDRDRGVEIYVRACNGVYLIIHPNYQHEVQFNPFSLEDTPANRQFLKMWMCELIKEPGENECEAALEQAISACVEYGYDFLNREHRYLSNVVKLLPINFPRWHRLRQWLRGDGIRTDGDYAYLFDNCHDKLTLNASKVGFDLTELMKQPPAAMAAVMMYLFHRIELSLDGTLVSIYLAEGWQYLNHPFWVKKLATWLPTLRKMNCHIVLDTQSPKTVVNSALCSEYLDNSATSIFFCNDKADEAIYKQFNITAQEFDFIKNTPKEKRLFLYKQNHESAICQLDLNGMSDVLAVLSGNKATVELAAQCRQCAGEDPEKWLPLFYELRKNKQN